MSEREAADAPTLASLAAALRDAEQALERARTETREALERQTATAEILSVISRSPTNARPVFEEILQKATQLCDAETGTLFRYDGAMFHPLAVRIPDAAFAAVRSKPITPGPLSGLGMIVANRAVVHAHDARLGAGYKAGDPTALETVDIGGARTWLGVPMLKEDKLVGALAIYRKEVRPFDDRQIALLLTFANQAAIAIENVRLFKETQEALERQTATAEILKVIASSPSDVQPVFDAIAGSAVRLIAGSSAIVVRRVADELHIAAHTATSAAGDEALKTMSRMALTGQGFLGKAVLSGMPVYVSDIETDAGYSESVREVARARGARSMLAVPMIREGAAIGAINVTRSTPGAFTEHQINLVKTFADQAVIAIENVRLFNETKEALERQTATAEILKVIAGSPTDVQPVFDAIAESAMRVFSCHSSVVTRVVGDVLQLAAATATDQAGLVALKTSFPRPLASPLLHSTAARTGKPAYTIDTENDAEVPSAMKTLARVRGYRSNLVVPMLREGVSIGTISVARVEAGQFTRHQIGLLETFADQAVIAIQNVRLFNETKEALERQTATAEILAVISSSPTDTQPVFEAIASSVVRLCEGLYTYVGLYDGKELSFVAYHNVSPAARAILDDRFPSAPQRGSSTGEAILDRKVVHIPDVMADPDYTFKDLAVADGYRAILSAPMLRDGVPIGVIAVGRRTPFSDGQIDLVQTFAAQAVIAIENVRLFHELEEKSAQLELASHHKSDFLASMSHELRTPLNAILGFNELILAEIYGTVPEDMKVPLTDIQTSGKHLLRLINNVLDLAKIEAGRMELALADYSVHDTVESVRSTLRPLAADKGLEFLASIPDDIPIAYGDSGRITQCLMNLAGNSLKFTKAGRVEIVVALQGATLVYRVNDTGIGIPPDKIDSLFTEFKQTDATIASEYGGTGLGLSISKKFIEMHGGRIWIESELGRGSSFIFEVPLRATEVAQ